MKAAKMKFLKHLANRKKVFVPIDSIPNGDKEIAEALLREGLIGIERLEKGINCVLLKSGHEFIEKSSSR
ncbi:MAG: hypothetical protein ABIE55_00785 [Candidatus Aenigmatarchaeota archaeon]